jgi:putative ABC transport system permease protein
MSGPNFYDVKMQSKALSDAAAYTRARQILTGRGEPVRLDGAQVSASIFDLLGVRPLLGRTFRAADNQPGNTHVAILPDNLWQQRCGGDRKVVGTTMTLDSVRHEIVGMRVDTVRSNKYAASLL